MKWTNDVSVVSTAMVVAIEEGDVDTVGDLLARGAPVRARGPGGATFLHLAASVGAVRIMGLLLDYEAPVDVQDDAGRTPWRVARDVGQAEAARVLREHAAASGLAEESV